MARANKQGYLRTVLNVAYLNEAGIIPSITLMHLHDSPGVANNAYQWAV